MRFLPGFPYFAFCLAISGERRSEDRPKPTTFDRCVFSAEAQNGRISIRQLLCAIYKTEHCQSARFHHPSFPFPPSRFLPFPLPSLSPFPCSSLPPPGCLLQISLSFRQYFAVHPTNFIRTGSQYTEQSPYTLECEKSDTFGIGSVVDICASARQRCIDQHGKISPNKFRLTETLQSARSNRVYLMFYHLCLPM